MQKGRKIFACKSNKKQKINRKKSEKNKKAEDKEIKIKKTQQRK
jgi:hypothetical protein